MSLMDTSTKLPKYWCMFALKNAFFSEPQLQDSTIFFNVERFSIKPVSPCIDTVHQSHNGPILCDLDPYCTCGKLFKYTFKFSRLSKALGIKKIG